jgi:hypothetical protein
MAKCVSCGEAIASVVSRCSVCKRETELVSFPKDPDWWDETHEAVVLAVPVVLWFTVAGLSMILQPHSTLNSAIKTIVLASTRAGILTAILYVLARGLAVLPVMRYNGHKRASTDD